MTFHDLLTLLENAHWDRYGTSPGWPWRRWLWEPWVGEFLRTYTAPAPQLETLTQTKTWEVRP